MSAVSVPAAEGGPFGREAELALLTHAVEALREGRGSVVEITGAPGIGKTRLTTALVELAARRGVPAVRAHAVRGNTRPLQVLHDAWEERRLSQPSAELPDRPDRWAAGCVLILDDLHWCDPRSTAAVVRLVRSVTPGPFLLALAHRPAQTPSVLLEALEDGVRAGRVTRLEPGPLDARAAAALLARHDATPREPDDAARLCAAADGNPFHLRLLAASGWHPDHGPDTPGPDTAALLREAKPLIAEVEALTPAAVLTASSAAVIGSPFRPEDLAHVCERDLDDTLDTLAELERADLVRPADRKGGLAFRHPVVGHVVHERAGVSFRLRAHRRALDLLTARGGRARQRARHAEHLLGADAARAVRALADGAADIVAQEPGTAANWLRLALEALPDAAARTGLELARCRALIAAGRLDEARTLAHDLLGRPDTALSAGEALQARTVCAHAERQLGRYPEAAAIIGGARDLLPSPLPSPLPAEVAEAIVEYGLVHVLRGTHEQARALIREAVRAQDGTEGAEAVLRVLDVLCATHAGDLDRASADAARCAALVDALPDPLAGRTPETLALLGSAELYLERFTDAARHLSRGLTATPSGAQRPVLLHRLLGLAVAEQWTGRLDASQRHARQVEDVAHSLGVQPAVVLARAVRATTLVWSRGARRAEEALALAEETTGTAPLDHSWWTASAAGLLAQARLLAGDPAGCRRTLLAHGTGERLPRVRPFSRPFLLSLLVTATLECGDREEAGRLVADAETEAGRLGLPVQEAHVRCARARLHAADGEHDAAAKLFALAADAFRQADMPVQYAWTLVTGAPSCHEAHGPAAALGHLDTADTVARRCSALLVQERSAQVRAALPAPSAGPLHLLSDREREIAGLAASGLRTRQIAERLFLSPRTVETHLARIYRKLEVSSRIALSDLLRAAK
ncbi:LuxR C-terminal-related transcriptional regulator [Streptomyces sp. NPDC004539]|uniref:LuxR C-terminal-related transcriptional regulator n=1 Tax=Streptomyces sp. NPDC004539 TaxID=3154280 RepID=UPI0033BBFA47